MIPTAEQVHQALTLRQQLRTSPENVADVLEALQGLGALADGLAVCPECFRVHQPAAEAPEDRLAKLDKLLATILNRRVTVEATLWDATAGKRPLPDAAMCRHLALVLGDPDYKGKAPTTGAAA